MSNSLLKTNSTVRIMNKLSTTTYHRESSAYYYVIYEHHAIQTVAIHVMQPNQIVHHYAHHRHHRSSIDRSSRSIDAQNCRSQDDTPIQSCYSRSKRYMQKPERLMENDEDPFDI